MSDEITILSGAFPSSAGSSFHTVSDLGESSQETVGPVPLSELNASLATLLSFYSDLIIHRLFESKNFGLGARVCRSG